MAAIDAALGNLIIFLKLYCGGTLQKEYDPNLCSGAYSDCPLHPTCVFTAVTPIVTRVGNLRYVVAGPFIVQRNKVNPAEPNIR